MEKKKVYRRPRLTVYGDIRAITQTSTIAGIMNDMTTGMSKSS